AVAGVGPLPTPDPASAAVQVTVTSLLFQPAAFGAGDSVALTVGPVLSRTNDAWPVPGCPPQMPCALNFGVGATVTAWTPSPVPAVNGNAQVDFAVFEVW